LRKDSKMNNMIHQMKLTAKAENARARKTWGTIGGADDFGKYGRSVVLPPKAEKIEALLGEGRSRRDISNILKITYQGVSDYIARYNLTGENQ
jgi:hypothetical protein